MFFGNSEIESIVDGIATLKDGWQISLTEKNKDLLTEESTTGSELQFKWCMQVANEIFSSLGKISYLSEKENDDQRKKAIVDLIDILHTNDVRITDIDLIFDVVQWEIKMLYSKVQETIQSKENEKLVEFFGKDKLSTIAKAFWANEDISDTSVRSVRMKDFFNT